MMAPIKLDSSGLWFQNPELWLKDFKRFSFKVNKQIDETPSWEEKNYELECLDDEHSSRNSAPADICIWTWLCPAGCV